MHQILSREPKGRGVYHLIIHLFISVKEDVILNETKRLDLMIYNSKTSR